MRTLQEEERELKKMKKKNVDQKVIRAISIGLSAVMAFTPITAMAEEGATVSGGDAESSQWKAERMKSRLQTR